MTSKPASRSQRVLLLGVAALGTTVGCVLISPTTIYLDSHVTKTLAEKNAEEDIISRSLRDISFSPV